MSETTTGADRRRVLVVEDNHLVAEGLRQLLAGMECEVIGPLATVTDGCAAAEGERMDGAVLDINLRDGVCGPVAQVLRERGCPFVFLTGYGSPVVGLEAFAEVPRLDKPVDEAALRRVLETWATAKRPGD